MVDHMDDAILMLFWMGSLGLVFVASGVLAWLYEAYRKWRYQRLVRRFGGAIPKSKLRWL